MTMTMTTVTRLRQNTALRTMTLAELLAHEFPPREDVVAPWLRQGESAMLYAAPGQGKTLVALTLALAVAGGGRVFGWQSPKPRPALYVDGEMHIQDLRDRLAVLANTIDGLNVETAGRNLTILCRQAQKADAQFPDLAKSEDQDTVLATAAVMNADLIVLDNFSTLAEVADENEAAAMSPVLTFLLRAKQANRATILVHHSDKTGANYRGSSKLATTFEVIIGLHRIDGRAATDGAGFELRWEKYRGKPTAATRDMEATLEEAEGGLTWETKPASRVEMLALLDLVRSGQFRTQREIAKKLGWDYGKVSRMKGFALGKGAISKQEWDACMGAAVDMEEVNRDF